MEQSYHSFLMALKGKTVTIYKGGPESKKGKLLDVKPDYIALDVQNNNNNDQNNQNTVVYYQVQHIKSVIEDSKTNSMQMMETQSEVDYVDAKCFMNLLEQFVEETVQINQGGPESKHGILVGVSDNFIILFTEDDGLVYINAQHIKSVSILTPNNQTGDKKPALQIPEWVCAKNFQEVFRHFSHQWVSINRGGPEAMEGVLVENVGGHYTIVNNQEVMRIQPFHIQSISGGPKGYLKQNNQDSNQDNQENEEDESSDEKQCEESSDDNRRTSSSSSSNRRTSSSSSSSRRTSSSSSSNRRTSSSSESRCRRSTRSTRRRSNRETIIKTIDYRWKK